MKTSFHSTDSKSSVSYTFLKRLCVLSLLKTIFCCVPAGAQGLVNNGARLIITTNTQMSVDGGAANGNFTNQDNGGTGIVENAGVLSVSGNWTNNSAQNVFATNSGSVYLTGTTQSIGGTSSTYFNSLSFTGTGTKTLNVNTLAGGGFAGASGILSLSASNLDLNTHTLTINNNSNAALTRTSGMIISETDAAAGYGIIKWNIGTQIANYEFPFGNAASSNYLPFLFNKTTAGMVSGTASVSVSTYPTVTSANPNNRPLPTGVSHLNNALNADNSAKVLDRYWVLDVQNYSTKPAADLTMTYRDSEHNTSGGSTNVITESSLKAQRWNGLQWLAQTGAVNVTSNTVSVTGVTDFNSVWALVASSSPLPIELISFDARLNQNRQVDVTWTTATEINNDYFTVERSRDGNHFESIGTVDGAGNSTGVLTYLFTDPDPYTGVSYYRLKQTDFNNSFTRTEMVSVTITDDPGFQISLFPNPVVDQLTITAAGDLQGAVIHIVNSLGQQVLQTASGSMEENNRMVIQTSGLAPGVYFLSLEYNGKVTVSRFVRK